MKNIILSLTVFLISSAAIALPPEMKEMKLSCGLFARVDGKLQEKTVSKIFLAPVYSPISLHDHLNEEFGGYRFYITGADEGLELLVIENLKTGLTAAAIVDTPSTLQFPLEGFHFSTMISTRKLDPRSGIYDIFNSNALVACDLETVQK